MEIDKPISCGECKHHYCPSCKRIEYGDGCKRIGKFWFRVPVCASQAGGYICSEFELQDFYFNSPSYADFTLDDYIIYFGIEVLEWNNLTKTGFTSRKTCDGVYKFEFMRNAKDGQRGYKIYKNDKEIVYYKQFGGWDNAFADWLDICRGVPHTEEYLQEVKRNFFWRSVLLSIDDSKKEWYCMDYRDFFYGNLFREDGKLNVYKRTWMTLPKGHGTYKKCSEYIDGLVLE